MFVSFFRLRAGARAYAGRATVPTAGRATVQQQGAATVQQQGARLSPPPLRSLAGSSPVPVRMDGPPSPLRALAVATASAADDSGEQPALLRYCVGEKLYYTGVRQDYNGDRLTYGACCEVREWTPQDTDAPDDKEKHVEVHVEGFADTIQLRVDEVGRAPAPPLPGGLSAGEQVYFIGEGYRFDNGDRILHGMLGTVAGPSHFADEAVAVEFEGNVGNNGVYSYLLSREKPAAQPGGLGGFCVDQEVYFTGESFDFHDGEGGSCRLVHGGSGEVVCPATGEFAGKALILYIKDHGRSVRCCFTSLSSEPPPALPGGFDAGERLFFVGATVVLPSGKKVPHGEKGEVIGPATIDTHVGRGVRLRFSDHRFVSVYTHSLSREPPPALPGGHSVGEHLYYTGESFSHPNGDRVLHGAQGEVVGPAKSSTHVGKGVRLRLSGVRNASNVYLTSLSSEPPPALPGGYSAGKHLFYLGQTITLKNGKRVLHGEEGEVIGPATIDTHIEKGVKLRFQNGCTLNLYLHNLCGQPPPALPGGFAVGEQLFLIGPTASFRDGTQVRHGEKGEVTGPATFDTHIGKGIKLRFNNFYGDFFLHNLSREQPLPGGFRVGERLFYKGPDYQLGKFSLDYGMQVEVVGPCRDAAGRSLGAKEWLDVMQPGGEQRIPCAASNLSHAEPPARSAAAELSTAQLRARRALASRRDEQERAAAGAPLAAEELAAEAERRQQLAAELLEEEAAAKAPSPTEAGKKRKKKKFRKPSRGTAQEAEAGQTSGMGAGASSAVPPTPSEDGSAGGDTPEAAEAESHDSTAESEGEYVTPLEEARRAEEAERAEEDERQARLLLEAAQREREERLERAARAAAAAEAAAEREARSERQQAARAAEKERRRAARQALVDEMEAQAHREESSRAAAPQREAQQLEELLARVRLEAAEARSEAAAAMAEEAAARSEADEARSEAEAARAREVAARGREEAAGREAAEARARQGAAMAREKALVWQLAALARPAASPPGPLHASAAGGDRPFHAPPSDSDAAAPGVVSCRATTLVQKVAVIREHLGLEPDSSLSAAVAAANERAGLAAEGGLLQQVDRLMALLFDGST